jgi:ABC-type nitrate/sulfonate/bicarbonate transport system substrate-binding protein
MKKLLSIVLLASLVMSTLAGCSQETKTKTTPTTGNQSASVERIKMRVAYMPNMGSASTMVTAIKMGYFNEEGIDVEPIKFAKGPEEIAAMGSGNIDVSQIGPGAHTLAAKGQAKIFTLDGTSIADEVLGNKDKGVNTIADLKGKTIGTSLGTSSETILNLALASVGMTQADVKVVQVDPSAAVTAMVTGKIDACAIWSPSTITVKEKLGDKVVMLANNNTFKDQIVFPSSWICTNEYFNKNQDKLVRFTKALLKAQDYKKAHIEEVAGWVAQLIEQDPETIKKSTGEGDWPASKLVYDMAKDGTLKKWYENQQKSFVETKALDKAVDVSNYYSPDIIIKAYEANQK